MNWSPRTGNDLSLGGKSSSRNSATEQPAAVPGQYPRYYLVLWPILVLTVSLAITTYFWRDAHESVKSELEARLEGQANSIARRVDSELRSHEQRLRGLQGLFRASDRVSRWEFRRYVDTIQGRVIGSGFVGLAFHELVARKDLNRHVAKIRADGFPDYHVFPAGARELYTPLVYIEPFSNVNRKVMGFDSYTIDVERTAIDRARDSGDVTISGMLTLAQDAEQGIPGFVMYAPIYQDSKPHGNDDERRSAFVGWVDSPIRIHELMRRIFPEGFKDIDVQIFDGLTMSTNTLFYDSNRMPHSHDSSVRPLNNVQLLQFGGHAWTLAVHASNDFGGAAVRQKPQLIAAVGTLLSLLLTLIALVVLRTHRRRVVAAIRRESDTQNEARRQLESRYGVALAAARAGTWEWDMATNTVSWSSEVATLSGLGEDSAPPSYKTWAASVHPDDWNEVSQTMSQCIKENRQFEIEYRIRASDVATHWLMARGLPVSVADGKAGRYHGVIIDITERKQQQEKVRQLLAENETILNNALVGIVYLKHRRVVSCNRRFEELFGYAPMETIGLSTEAFYESREFFQEIGWRSYGAIARGEVFNEEVPLRRRDGSIFWGALTGRAIDQSRPNDGSIWIYADISERKRTADSLRIEQERLDLAVTATGLGLYDWNPTTGSVVFSEIWMAIVGCRKEEILNGYSTWADRIHPDDMAASRKATQEAFHNDSTYRCEYRLRYRDGSWRWILDQGRIVTRDPEGRVTRFVGAILDVTERKHAEELSRTNTEQLQLLHEVSQRLNRTLIIGEIYQEVCDFMSVVAPNDAFAISAYDAESQLITCRAYFMGGKWLDVSGFPAIPLEEEGRGTQSIAIRNGEPLLIADYQARIRTARNQYFVDDKTNKIVMEMPSNEDVTRSALVVPMKTGGIVSGVIQVMSYQPDAFTERQLRLLDALSLHIASAERNATLYAQVQAELNERKVAEEQLLKLSLAVEQSPESIVITNLNAEIEYVNEAFVRNTGYTREEAIGMNPRILNSGKTPAKTFASMWDTLTQGQPWKGEMQNRRKDGSEYFEQAIITPIRQPDGRITHYVAVKEDITSRKKSENQINTLAFYDSLTNLPNRRLLLDRLKQALASSARNKRYGALLFIDLDNFKTLNDTLGHDIGDLLLFQVAQRLTTCVREGDTVARLGGDEFVVMLEDLSENMEESAAQTKTVGEKILATLNQPYQLASYSHHSTPSIGVTLFSAQQESIDELLKRTDLAMYQAKAAGRNTLRFFDPQMQAVVSARAALEADLREAVLTEQFLLHYQAQVVGESRVTGVEVLLRWPHPKRGMVSPADFIPLAEDTGLILPIGRWVLQTACARLAIWAARPEMAHLTIAVNVSARQFHHKDFVEQVLAVLDHTGANPQRLKLELTESLLVDDVEGIIAKMSALKAQGVGFSMDDFGTGYSSLSYLKRLPLDQLKIDQGFVRDILTDANDAAIANMVVVLAGSLDLAVIAEGVETEAQREFLAYHDCHAYQGYLFSRPLPLIDFEQLACKVFDDEQRLLRG